ncbi:MAG: hypothetical protein AAGD04_06910 [Pseudomonadota bacterium]
MRVALQNPLQDEKINDFSEKHDSENEQANLSRQNKRQSAAASDCEDLPRRHVAHAAAAIAQETPLRGLAPIKMGEICMPYACAFYHYHSSQGACAPARVS